MSQDEKTKALTQAEIERRRLQGPNADFDGPQVLNRPATVDTREPEAANQGSQGSKPKPADPD